MFHTIKLFRYTCVLSLVGCASLSGALTVAPNLQSGPASHPGTLAFKEMDKDNSGSIDRTEMLDIYRSLGYDAKVEDMKDMMGGADHDSNGKIDLNEFLAMVHTTDSAHIMDRVHAVGHESFRELTKTLPQLKFENGTNVLSLKLRELQDHHSNKNPTGDICVFQADDLTECHEGKVLGGWSPCEEALKKWKGKPVVGAVDYQNVKIYKGRPCKVGEDPFGTWVQGQGAGLSCVKPCSQLGYSTEVGGSCFENPCDGNMIMCGNRKIPLFWIKWYNIPLYQACPDNPKCCDQRCQDIRKGYYTDGCKSMKEIFKNRRKNSTSL